MSAFLAGLGAALSEGSALAGRRRQERRQEELDRQSREQQLLQMALAQRSFAGDEQDRARGFAKDLIEQIGPEGDVSEQTYQDIFTGGFGDRVTAPQTQTTVNPVGLQTIQLEGLPQKRTLLPTTTERITLDATRRDQAEKDRFTTERERAREAISLPGFQRMPEMNRAVVWQQAGFDGEAPTSVEDWKQRTLYQADLQRRNALDVEAARTYGDQREAEIRARHSARPLQLAVSERNALNDAALSRSAIAQLRELRKGGQFGGGQLTGRANAFRSVVPESMRDAIPGLQPDKDYANYAAITAGLKNRTIRAITGAAVGVQEEKRIMAEIPDEYSEDDIWEAKAEATENNLIYLEQLIQDRAAGRTTAPSPVNEFTGRPAVNAVRPGAGRAHDPMGLFGPR